ncbi:Mediator of RNA polymerase II transcription subunit 22 [Halotydeus destructor]|nr:Mediator of RNA polymerase II transcription subunit 22 [Halotydeus destructor]
MSSAQEVQLRSYQKRLRDDVKSITDHFVEIIKLVKVEQQEQNVTPARIQETTYEMHVRAANITRAAESIMKLIWDIKQYLIINDFPLINSAISLQSSKEPPRDGNQPESNYVKADNVDMKLMHLRDEITNELYELEDEYYNTLVK